MASNPDWQALAEQDASVDFAREEVLDAARDALEQVRRLRALLRETDE